MKFIFELNDWFITELDKDGDFLIESNTVDGDTVVFYTRHRNHVRKLIKDIEKIGIALK
jgi:hypothetical protein